LDSIRELLAASVPGERRQRTQDHLACRTVAFDAQDVQLIFRKDGARQAVNVPCNQALTLTQIEHSPGEAIFEFTTISAHWILGETARLVAPKYPEEME
jgi:hypothetical protein